MIQCSLDHLVVVAPSLNEGVTAVSALLGVELQRGGEHSRMGTHNALLRIGAASYLEVIARNPSAPDPGRPRWFELDRADGRVRLATWVARTTEARVAAAASPVDLGLVESMTRGDLEWRITVPSGGRLLEGGVVPMLIEWTSGSHPSGRLPDLGVRLERLELEHPNPELIRSFLRWVGFEGPVSVVEGGQASLAARLTTPQGSKTLRS
ncbi:MAG TPA: VOC family protein [Candidatus Eisenbacteria bacterium]|nr:VOC family protein [Candidatus Eisenbacteria bacterium]